MAVCDWRPAEEQKEIRTSSRGRIISPKQTADLLLTLLAISRTRFFSPGEIRERMLNAADPVVTSDGSRLRFEVFSVCCGTYARLDLQPDALDAQWLGKGTTNVDFNPPIEHLWQQS